MIANQPNVLPNARYELKAAAEALQVTRSTLLRWTSQGLIRVTISAMNGRKIWTGEEILRCWKSHI